MELEFELDVHRIDDAGIIVYNVFRKGLPVGRLILGDPYHLDKRERKTLVMA